jgi:hypothetical protein
MIYPPYKLDCGIKLNSITSINNKRKILTRPNLEKTMLNNSKACWITNQNAEVMTI